MTSNDPNHVYCVYSAYIARPQETTGIIVSKIISRIISLFVENYSKFRS